MRTYWSQALRELSAVYTPSEAKSVLRLIQEVRFRLSPVDICLDGGRELTIEERTEMQNILARLKKKEPVQYVLGRADFCGLSLIVAPGVLIPRPETEELVDWIAADHATSVPALLDVGTGSGCIAVAVAKRLPQAIVSALDVSAEALNIARRNAAEQGVGITFRQTDILLEAEIESDTPQWDVIVSNPPYVRLSEACEMTEQVMNHEPHLALFVPDDDPLRFYRALAHYAIKHLRPGGHLYLEINAALGSDTVSLLSEHGLHDVRLRRDFCNRDRIIRCTR